MKCSSSPTSMPTPAYDNIQLSAIMNMINKLSDTCNFNSVATRLENRMCEIEGSVEKRVTVKFNTVIHDRVQKEICQLKDEMSTEVEEIKEKVMSLEKSYAEAFGKENDYTIKSGRVIRKQESVNSVNSDYNSSRANGHRGQSTHSHTHNYQQQVNRHGEYTNEGRSFGDGNRRGRGGFKQSRDSQSDIYTIPSCSPFYLCGDWNSRVTDIPDFITGIDNLPERQVLNFTHNTYGDILWAFLSNFNCCILNGRNSLHCYFTYVSTRGASVVDNCIVPYKKLTLFDNFEVIRAQQLIDSIFKIGEYEPKHISNHSLSCWTFSTPVCLNDKVASDDKLHTEPNKSTKFDTRNIPNEWMADVEIVGKLNQFIQNLKLSGINQKELDNKYNDLVTIIHDEMNSKLTRRKVGHLNGLNNKRRKLKKPWWNDNLTALWNEVCEAERKWNRSHNQDKKNLRHIFVNKRKLFDKNCQQTKRQYWYRSQDKLFDIQTRDLREFWKTIGKIGVSSERQKTIPMEVVLKDGSIYLTLTLF
ncbi:Hypothetical predicted protein [Mytilus galloprovincialis]|uniref:Endonuclease/exonuclease/phosphatase domain-containing protein n=1 Tax=Mytilus galloprovincialis TaxID=29158 RepID=A0A8B6GKB6_MYTGA|nr:Hypothetical predicted protein [Mytilus galloprovincialis]